MAASDKEAAITFAAYERNGTEQCGDAYATPRESMGYC